MEPLGLLFSSSGRLAPRPFAIAVILVYVAGFASQALLSGAGLLRAGILPFALVQAILTWVWYALHAKRARDAGRGTGGAAGIAVLYALAIVLLLMVLSFFANLATPTANGEAVTPSNVFGFLAILYILVPILTGADLSFLSMMIVSVLLVAMAPGLIAIAYSIIAGTRASAPPVLPVAPSAPVLSKP